MKNITVAMKAHLAGGATTLCHCWKVILKDGTIYGFTDHHSDIRYDNILYLAKSGYAASAIDTSADFGVDNLEVEGILDSDFIKDSDIIAGKWDYATVEIFKVNYKDLNMGDIKLRKGILGEFKLGRGRFIAELRGLMQHLTVNVGESYSVTCRANFCDSRCKLNISDFTEFSLEISNVSSANDIIFIPANGHPNNYWNYGIVKFISGNNTGYSMEVYKSYSTGEVKLYLPLPEVIKAGDLINISKGCDKSFTQCKAYGNSINFRGEPFIPGLDKIIQVGNRNSSVS